MLLKHENKHSTHNKKKGNENGWNVSFSEKTWKWIEPIQNIIIIIIVDGNIFSDETSATVIMSKEQLKNKSFMTCGRDKHKTVIWG